VAKLIQRSRTPPPVLATLKPRMPEKRHREVVLLAVTTLPLVC
jgi:hypothetical protein